LSYNFEEFITENIFFFLFNGGLLTGHVIQVIHEDLPWRFVYQLQVLDYAED